MNIFLSIHTDSKPPRSIQDSAGNQGKIYKQVGFSVNVFQAEICSV